MKQKKKSKLTFVYPQSLYELTKKLEVNTRKVTCYRVDLNFKTSNLRLDFSSAHGQGIGAFKMTELVVYKKFRLT
jgi:hypothetical protein